MLANLINALACSWRTSVHCEPVLFCMSFSWCMLQGNKELNIAELHRIFTVNPLSCDVVRNLKLRIQ